IETPSCCCIRCITNCDGPPHDLRLSTLRAAVSSGLCAGAGMGRRIPRLLEDVRRLARGAPPVTRKILIGVAGTMVGFAIGAAGGVGLAYLDCYDHNWYHLVRVKFQEWRGKRDLY